MAGTAAPLRYLLLATHVPASGSGGGMVRYAVETAAALARRPDVQLHVLVTAEAVEFFSRLLGADRVHVIRSAPTVVRSVAERYLPVRGLSAGGFDVVHGAKHLLPRRTGRATAVLTVHDMLPLDRPGDFGLLKRLVLRLPYLASVREADLLVCVSRATRARLLDYQPAVAARTATVPLAPSERLLTAAPAPVPALAGRPFALVVGDPSARKNVGLVVDGWPRVRRRNPDAVLAVAGPAAWHGAHRGKRWDELVASGAVVSLGHVDDAALAWCFRNARALLCPSLLEGFGLPAAEAVAFGTPLVASEDPALGEAAAGAPGVLRVPTWSPQAWVDAISAALEVPVADDRPPGPHRTWDDVAAELVAAVQDVRGGGRRPAPDPVSDDRIGVSPYAAPLRVRHVVGPDAPWDRAAVEAVADAHREQGWTVEVGDTPAGEPPDVTVLHGLEAGAARSGAALGRATVVVAGTARPRGPGAWLREIRLAARTDALLVDRSVAGRWARRVPVPLATSVDGFAPGTKPSADELATVIARSLAWGS